MNETTRACLNHALEVYEYDLELAIENKKHAEKRVASSQINIDNLKQRVADIKEVLYDDGDGRA